MPYANLASTLKKQRTTAINDAIGPYGWLELHTSMAPASPDLVSNDVLLAKLSLSNIAGVVSLAVQSGVVTASGTGGTNGVFALSIDGNAEGVFQVSGGALISTSITDIGSGYETVPNLRGFETAGLSGASAIAIMTSILTFNLIATATALATGNVGWARITTNSGAGIIDLDVGTTNASSIMMTNTFISAGGPVTCAPNVLIEA